MKYKVGDYVRVVKPHPPLYNKYIGRVVKILMIQDEGELLLPLPIITTPQVDEMSDVSCWEENEVEPACPTIKDLIK